MKYLIDTSSLLSLARYYLPFDKYQILFSTIKNKIDTREILFLDKVYYESHISKNLILDRLPFLTNKKIRINTTNVLPDQEFFNQLENQFINGLVKNNLTEIEFEKRKAKYLESADCKLLLYALKLQKENVESIIVTEETSFSNDNKEFKKLPSICKILGIKTIALPELINLFEDVQLVIK